MRHEGARTACGACCTRLAGLSVTLEDLPVLRDVSMHLHCGEMTAVIGPNGAGKTTLVRAILGQVPYRGSVTFTDAQGDRFGTPRIGYVPQTLSIDPLAPVTVLDFVGAALSRAPAFLAPGRRKREAVREALARVDAQGLADRRLGALSGGETQRVLLALALAPTPDLLLLDEPSSGIDAEGLSGFYARIDSVRRDYDVSVLLISHDLELVNAYADRVVLLNHEVLAIGAPDAVMESEAFGALFPAYAAARRQAQRAQEVGE